MARSSNPPGDSVAIVTDPLPLRIFLASPDDLADVRPLISAWVDEFNLGNGTEASVQFEVVGWEQVRGTARRPQEAINELIAESHFLVALLRKKWGSNPGSPWGYTSGTEEELFTGLLELGRPERPMRDVWVAFLHHPESDPKIESLRRSMTEAHSMLYESVPTLDDLKHLFAQRLEGWIALADHKVPRYISLLPSSGVDVLQAATLRLRGEKLIDLGQSQAGVRDLREAAAVGGPVEHLAYARHLGRSGDFAAAYAETQRAIDFFTNGSLNLYTPLAAEAFEAQAGILRRQRQPVDAIGRLQHALTLIVEDNTDAEEVRCRILDDLGLAFQASGDLKSARDAYETALSSRRAHGQTIDVAQSLVNLARLDVASEDLSGALELAEEAQRALAGTAPSGLHANANVSHAQILLRLGRAKEALDPASRALIINTQLAHRQGEAISLYVLAQCYRSMGDAEHAPTNAKASLQLNLSMGDETGARKAQWIIDNPAA